MRLSLRHTLVVLAVAACLAVTPALAISTTVVISQVYGAGGNTGAVLRNDYIELFNRGTTTVSLTGWSVQYTSATGTGLFSSSVTSLSGSLAPGQYYLIQESSGGANGVLLPAADATGTIAMAAGSGKVILANTTTGVACNGSSTPCSAAQLAQIVDLVGYGTANFFEGAGAAPTINATTADFRALGGCTDTDGNSADFSTGAPAPRNTSSPLNVCGGPPLPNLTINDVSLNEGDAGTTTFTFTVSLSAPAGAGGVTFDIATADNTATQPGDYTLKSLTGQTIPAGSSTYTFDVLVNGDTTPETGETFFVNVTNVTGATATDGQGQGTIVNDDVTLTPIHDIQGPGASSPLSGSVTTRGIVTGVKSNGFFIQEPDASVDADPLTSEGILVFTGSAPPAAAAAGNLVQVTGTISEFVPSADPFQPPLTELTSPTVSLVSSGNPLPAAIPLNATFPDPAGVHDQLERLEGMRVSAASLTVTGPTLGSLSEANANSTSTGVFYGVITGVARPYREAGIPAPDPAPSGGGTIPPIPRFDSNPERIRVDSDGQTGGPLIDVNSGAVVTGLTGPLDYSFRTYTILPDPGASIGVTGGMTSTAAAAPTGREFTVGTYNMERFFDTVDDPGKSDVALTAAAFDKRLAKASLAIRDNLRMPDILGVVEMEKLTVLQTLAARISSDAVAASQPDPQYAAYLVEGNDIGGIDVGFLVKTAEVAVGTPRVEVVTVQQESAGTLFVNPDASTELLNDRPPLRLNAIVHHPNGASFGVTAIVNHLRSLGSVNSEAAGSNGWSTAGARVRAKRQAQAEDLANLVQARQTADPAERIILLGDFNAFEVNDGLGDSMDVIAGTPVPDNETAVPGDGVDLVNPDLDNLWDSPPAGERYSYVFDGNAQNLDHVLINGPLTTGTVARRIEHPRINADFAETSRNDGTTPVRLSDHDPVVAFFQVQAFTTAVLSVTKVESADPVVAGSNLTYTVTLSNAGPDPADNVSWSDTLPAGTAFSSLSAPGGWSCSTPAVGSGGTVSCSLASQAVGSDVFTLVVAVDPSVAAGTVLSNTVTVTSDQGGASATETTTVSGSADLSILKTATPDPVSPGGTITYTISVNNEGPSSATSAMLSDPLPVGTTFLSITTPAGWGCVTPAVGANGTVTCTAASFPAGSAVFTLVVQVGGSVAGGTLLDNTVTVSSATADPNPGNESATTFTTVGSTVAGLTLAITDAPDPVTAGFDVTYTITVTATITDGMNAALSLPLPPGTTFQSLVAPGGWSCTAPAVGSFGTASCSAAALATGSTVFDLTVHVPSSAAGGSSITDTASLAVETDGRAAVASDMESTLVAAPTVLSATKTAAGQLRPGGTVTYTVVLSNAGPGAQGDNPGDELTDVLPPEVTLVSASATSGTAVATVATNTVTWNGSIAAGGSVTITIQAVIATGLPAPAVISNQAAFSYDANGDGVNESSGVTDDPGAPGSGDPTVISLASVIDIPALDVLGLALLSALLAAAAAWRLRRA